MTVEETPPYYVEVGDGRKIPCEGVCPKLKLVMQGLEIHEDFFVFELGGVNIVLGMEWLSSLGEIRANFKELMIKIPLGSSYHVLKGEPELARALASFKSIMKAIKNEGQGFFLEYETLAKEKVHDTPQPD